MFASVSLWRFASIRLVYAAIGCTAAALSVCHNFFVGPGGVCSRGVGSRCRSRLILACKLSSNIFSTIREVLGCVVLQILPNSQEQNQILSI